ncbi:hypothetical protein ASPZODRAFT_160015 [Penicilliopsis zonata CBS 506.65]|uniref:Amino acid permease/ SLC12A domain-containing protein n=1 Tax=Penicilliopsis zonata CBS 506.65 TaxID=1073090 RepID=A0A1L9SF59_9EURO|nr:hypothetical protein ASPZODRAFT_160015 [Penicilliopsis zonata CBS 506.65]OJJ45782.1 hypothetical protein ASPZODRAFT_160015 [Penicilliopsis zonata CBS 506.65]
MPQMTSQRGPPHAPYENEDTGSVVVLNGGSLQRQLGNRHLQIIAIGGSIGTAAFVSVGTALAEGGPGSLFIAYVIYAVIMGMLNNCAAEMVVYMPVSGGFVRLAGHWVDEALGFMAGWNFLLYEGIMIPFEITALQVVLSFWSDKVPAIAICLVCIFLYGLLNVFAVRVYGEAEFWLSTGKILLLTILFCFTFITMVGGNPQGDAYGFRHWNHPGAFAEYLSTGSLGRFQGFLACLWNAAFLMVGPELISMMAAEAKQPRIYLKSAYKTVYVRFAIMFVGTGFCVGILVAYNDPTLVAIVFGDASGSGTAAASPYVIAMHNMGVTALPHLVNALLCTSIFSAGNNIFYNATRTLYSLALQGKAPKQLAKCTKDGVPIYAFGVTMLFPFLSLLSLSKSSETVLTWLLNLVTAAGIIDFIVIAITYISFYRACKAQGVSRDSLPYKGWFQPYSGYIALVAEIVIVLCYGYTSFDPWNVSTFFTHYTMVIVAVVIFFFWKFYKKTRWLRPHEVDLVWEKPLVDLYESTCEEPLTTFWGETLDMVRFWKVSKQNDLD